MVRLRQQGQREAGRLWGRVKPDDLDGTFPLGQLELTVSTLQREAARLSSAYLSTFIASELGEPERPPALSVWDKAFGGGDLREGLRSAVIKTKVAIGEGEDPQRATRNSKAILVSDVGLFIDTAARESLRQGMEMDDRIVGYQRALKGTCGACAGNVAVETSVELPSIPLRIHPNCQCVTEPVVTGRPANHLNPTKLSSRNANAMQRYVGTPRSVDINNALRGLVRETEGLKADRAALDLAFQEAGPLGEMVQAFRATAGLPPGVQAGRTFTEKGFSSTTAFEDIVAEGDVFWSLRIDPRVRGVWGQNPVEGELVLERGCRYVVETIKMVDGGREVTARVLPPA
jgi:hypothetical protein